MLYRLIGHTNNTNIIDLPVRFITKAPARRIIIAIIAVMTSMVANILLYNIFDF
jgi:hypothetical protein